MEYVGQGLEAENKVSCPLLPILAYKHLVPKDFVEVCNVEEVDVRHHVPFVCKIAEEQKFGQNIETFNQEETVYLKKKKATKLRN